MMDSSYIGRYIILIVMLCVLSYIMYSIFWGNKPQVTIYSKCDFLGKTQRLGTGTHDKLPFDIRALDVPHGCGVTVGAPAVAAIDKKDVAYNQTVKRKCLPEGQKLATVEC